MNFNSTDAIIFDLGGVIINLDVQKLYRGFAELSGLPLEQIKNHRDFLHDFHLYETGKMNNEAFRDSVRAHFHLNNCSDDALDHIWNAMLLDIPLERVQLLLYLKDRFRIFLLSNTNGIHMDEIFKKWTEVCPTYSFESVFEHAYYSFKMGLRKPDPSIYQRVIDEQKLLPEKTVFIDDIEANLQGASQVGIRTQLVDSKFTITELFRHV